MISNFFSHKFILMIITLSSLFAIFFYSVFQNPFTDSIGINSERVLIFSFLALLASTFYFLSTFLFKRAYLPESKLAKILFLTIPAVALISTIFAKGFSNAFFGESLVLDSFVSFVALVFFVYAISIASHFTPKLTWVFFVIGNLLLTLPIILALIFVKFNFIETANYLTKLVDSWDTVAAMASSVIIFTLVYVETIAYNKVQKTIGNVIIFLHIILVLCITMPDTWYALTLSSLVILFINRKNFFKDYYKRSSFYVFILSLILSILFTLSPTITKVIQNTTVNFSKINYNFVKPSIGTSLYIGNSEMLSGNIFGSGPSRFYTLWREYKPKEVINSGFWDKDFTSSYSALTTYYSTIGIFGLLAFIFIIISILISIKKKLSSEKFNDLDDEYKFYLLGSISVFILGTSLFFIFGNIIVSTILFVAGTGMVIGRVINWKEEKRVSRFISILSLILLLVIISGFIVNLNRVRAATLYNESLQNFNKNKDFAKLESDLIRVAEISKDDITYSQLSQFYVQKAQNILSTNTDKELAQKEFVSAANNAIKAAKTAVSINEYNYNNYITLGSAYELQSIINKDTSYTNAKESYLKAQELYKNNPYIPLIIARLEWSHNKNAENTTNKIDEALKIKENYSLAYYLLSQLSIQNNDKASAEKYALQAINADNTNVNAYLQYGILTLNSKNLAEAELAFLSILDLNPSNLDAMYYLAVTYVVGGEYDTAQKFIDILKTNLPNSKEVSDLETYLNESKKPKELPKTKAETKAKSKK